MCNVTFQKLSSVARDLARLRKDCAVSIAFAEKALTECMDAFCAQSRSSLRQMARDMGISAAYLSDVRRGKRKVSDSVLEKLRRLK